MQRKKWMWGLLAAALLLPAVAYATKTLAFPAAACPLGCQDCPFGKK